MEEGSPIHPAAVDPDQLGLIAPGKPADHHVQLDVVRGLAALAVLSGHLRSFVFQDYAIAPAHGLFWTIFYFLTGFGHQAVMVFFVLSGYLIGGTIHASHKSKRWSWSDYTIKRLVRLWLVLVPAVLLTGLWDSIGAHVYHSAFYSGALQSTYHSGPVANETSVSRTPLTALLNILFLQTILAPTFGSNGPLWSLANEFWYYVIFPLAFFGCANLYRWRLRVPLLLSALTICLVLPSGLILGGVVWLLGYCVYRARGLGIYLPKKSKSLSVAATLILFTASLIMSRRASGNPFYNDFLISVTFCILLWTIIQIEIGPLLTRVFPTVLSKCSYTLYLCHFPFAALLAAALLPRARFSPGLVGIGWYVFMCASTLTYSVAIYYVFERNTNVIRTFIFKLTATFTSKRDVDRRSPLPS